MLSKNSRRIEYTNDGNGWYECRLLTEKYAYIEYIMAHSKAEVFEYARKKNCRSVIYKPFGFKFKRL